MNVNIDKLSKTLGWDQEELAMFIFLVTMSFGVTELRHIYKLRSLV